MNKTRSRATEVREMREEYRFDYSESRPNPYAARLTQDTVTIVLDPDVAAVFRTAHDVNDVLRSIIAALPRQATTRLRKKAG